MHMDSVMTLMSKGMFVVETSVEELGVQMMLENYRDDNSGVLVL